MRNLNKVLTISLAVIILAALGCLVYVVAASKQGEKFTEFYILDTAGETTNYPEQAVLNEPVELIVGVTNHENEPTSYRVEITMGGILLEEINTGQLYHEETWEEVASFSPQTLGALQKAEFWLYKNNEAEPCFQDPLHIYLDVNQFYILNAEGIAGGYPTQVALGEPVDLIPGIVNDEDSPTSYRVDLVVNGVLSKTVNTGPLSHMEKWEEPVSFISQEIGAEQKIEFQFYEEGGLGYSLEETLSLDIEVTRPAFFPAEVTGYTEFYILNAEGRAEDYPSQLTLGEPVELIVGVVSHEYELTSYRLVIKVGGSLLEVVKTGPLSHMEKWEESVSFTPQTAGERQEVALRLYKVGEADPCFETPIHFYINVTESS